MAGPTSPRPAFRALAQSATRHSGYWTPKGAKRGDDEKDVDAMGDIGELGDEAAGEDIGVLGAFGDETKLEVKGCEARRCKMRRRLS